MTDLVVWPFIERLPVLDLAFPGEGLTIPDSLDKLVNWVKDMWEVPAIKEYGCSPEIHLQYRKASANTGIPDFDFLIRPSENKPAEQRGFNFVGEQTFPPVFKF